MTYPRFVPRHREKHSPGAPAFQDDTEGTRNIYPFEDTPSMYSCSYQDSFQGSRIWQPFADPFFLLNRAEGILLFIIHIYIF